MKKNIIPLFLLLLMIFSIIGACVFKHWSFMFLAAEFILFHLVPPFTVLLSMLAYKKKAGLLVYPVRMGKSPLQKAESKTVEKQTSNLWFKPFCNKCRNKRKCNKVNDTGGKRTPAFVFFKLCASIIKPLVWLFVAYAVNGRIICSYAPAFYNHSAV